VLQEAGAEQHLGARVADGRQKRRHVRGVRRVAGEVNYLETELLRVLPRPFGGRDGKQVIGRDDRDLLGRVGQVRGHLQHRIQVRGGQGQGADRKSTRLNSSHVKISYAVFCL